VGPRAGLDAVEKRKLLILPGLELQPLDCPALIQSLYRLSYPGSPFLINLIEHSVARETVTKLMDTTIIPDDGPV
jgi:hypothetical protein